METALIVFTSSVSGSRLKNLASRAGYKNINITQTPSRIKAGGCSYSLRVYTYDLKNILAIAARNNIHYNAVYTETHDVSGTLTYTKI